MTRAHPTEIPYLLAFFPSLRAASDRTLSVYFQVRPGTYDGKFYDMEFKRLVQKHRHKLSDEDLEVVDREIPRIKAQLEIVRPVACPSMAAFADEPKGLVRLIRLPEATEERFEVDPPLLAPLELMLRKHPPSLIVLVDKEKAQTFAGILDEVIPQHHFEGTQVKHIKSGENKNPNLQHKEENRMKANMAAVVRIIDREVSAVSYKRLYLAGPDGAVAALEKLLPPSLKKIIAGRLSASLEKSVGELEVELRKQLRAIPAKSA
jgi:hypothetical protein